ncbi:MAG: TRAM domain-containing protein [Thermoanaerobaculia bacterium]|nr:TRAM domain-containing protein [Thermoanaerobaculia bacterium]
MTSQSPPRIGDLVEIEIEKLVAGGEGLGRAGGFVIFARPAFPGDRVRVEITEARRSFARGIVEELISPGSERKASPCPIAAACGGCDWTSYRLDAQLRAKRQILIESLTRIGKLPAEEIPGVALHASALDYRLRSRLHFDDDGTPGFFEIRSHTVVPLIPECEVIGPQLRSRIVRDDIRGAPGSERVFLENERELISGDPSDDGESLVFSVRGFRYTVGLSSFFQVNRHLLGSLVDLVMAHAEKSARRDRALDLYGGVGFFAIPLATRFSKVVSVESDPQAHRLAKENGGSAGVDARKSDVLAYLERETARPDFVFLDPPRSGAHPDVIDGIDRLDPESISYLSCDPVRLARDLAKFRSKGWKLESLDLVDLFPNTHHVETLVSLSAS